MCVVIGKYTSLEAVLAAQGRKIPVNKPSDFITFAQGKENIKDLLGLETITEVEAWKETFEKHCGPPKELVGTLDKGRRTIVGHLKTRTSQATAATRKSEKEQERAQIAHAKAKATAVAKRLRAPAPPVVDHSCPIASLNVGLFSVVLKVKDFTRSCLGTEPVLLDADSTKPIAAWIGEPKVMDALTEFANKYKKTSDFKDTGRMQLPFTDKSVKTVTNTMVEAMKPADNVDISTMAGGATFKKQIWAFGWSETMVNAAFTPQCASLLRILAGGEVDIFITDPASLLALGPPLSQESDTPTLLKAFGNLSVGNLKWMGEAGHNVYQCRLLAPCAIWIPQGSLALEVVRRGPLMYENERFLIVYKITF